MCGEDKRKVVTTATAANGNVETVQSVNGQDEDYGGVYLKYHWDSFNRLKTVSRRQD